MKILLLLLFPCMAHAQYRPLVISSVTPRAIMRNFDQVALRVSRSLDKYGNDTVYGSPTFNKSVTFKGTNTFTGGNSFVSASTFTGTVNLPAGNKIILASAFAASSSTLFGATTNSTSFVCLAGSSVTMTIQNNSRVLISWSGMASADVGQATYFVTAYDGSNCVNNASGSTLYTIHSTGVGYNGPGVSGTCLTPTLSAGVHGFCVNAKVSGGGANGITADTGFLSAVEIR